MRHEVVERTLEEIDRRLSEELSVGELARNGGISPAHLIRLFKSDLGITPSRYLWDRRTRQGARLLQETGLTVAEIAYRCGFQTPFHFSRLVKKTFGCSPRELRNRTWQTTNKG